jgi:hypothetical protein
MHYKWDAALPHGRSLAIAADTTAAAEEAPFEPQGGEVAGSECPSPSGAEKAWLASGGS